MATTVKIKPPLFSELETKKQGLDDLLKWARLRLQTDMKQYRAYKLKQIDKKSEVYCYYHERVILLKDFIAKLEEASGKHQTFRI